jgi:hypothetical protein
VQLLTLFFVSVGFHHLGYEGTGGFAKKCIFGSTIATTESGHQACSRHVTRRCRRRPLNIFPQRASAPASSSSPDASFEENIALY